MRIIHTPREIQQETNPARCAGHAYSGARGLWSPEAGLKVRGLWVFTTNEVEAQGLPAREVDSARACNLAAGTRIWQSYPPAQKIHGYKHEHAASTIFLQNPSPAPWFPRPSFSAVTESFLLNFRAKTFTIKGTGFWNQGYMCSFCIGKQNTPLLHMQISHHLEKHNQNMLTIVEGKTRLLLLFRYSYLLSVALLFLH